MARKKNEYAAKVRDVLKLTPKGQRAAPTKKTQADEINPIDSKVEYAKDVAYSIEDPAFGVLNVRKTANAWWSDRSKVESLIFSFKLGCTLEESYYMAGINKDKYEYFMEVHPGFSEVRPVLLKNPTLEARKTLVSNLHDPQYALAYLERKERKEFSKNSIDLGDSGEDLGVILLPVRQSPDGVRVETEALGRGTK